MRSVLSSADADTDAHKDASTTEPEDSKPGAKLLSAIAEESAASRTATYGCPVCRKPHILDLDRLQVDQTLTDFIKRLQLRQKSIRPAASTQGPATAPVPCRRKEPEEEVISLQLAQPKGQHPSLPLHSSV